MIQQFYICLALDSSESTFNVMKNRRVKEGIEINARNTKAMQKEKTKGQKKAKQKQAKNKKGEFPNNLE